MHAVHCSRAHHVTLRQASSPKKCNSRNFMQRRDALLSIQSPFTDQFRNLFSSFPQIQYFFLLCQHLCARSKSDTCRALPRVGLNDPTFLLTATRLTPRQPACLAVLQLFDRCLGCCLVPVCEYGSHHGNPVQLRP
jgi:hypothetical protein